MVGAEDPIVAAIVELLGNKGQVVLYGPPGSGKTYTARRVARQMLRGGGFDLDHATADRSLPLAERPLGLVGATGQTKPEGHFDHPETEEYHALIEDQGRAAMWYSFSVAKWSEILDAELASEGPKGEELKGRRHFYLYQTISPGRVIVRYRVVAYRTRKKGGLKSPWPDATPANLLGKTSHGEAVSQTFRTWFLVDEFKRLEAIPVSNLLWWVEAEDGVRPMRPSDLNQSAFRLVRELSGRESAAYLSRPEDIEKARITVVQFHPSYTYEDFVAGLVADPSGEGFTFTAQNKVFRELCETARSQKPSPFVLLIDEINRADMAKVFGELIYALEYRDEPVETVYQVGDSKEMIVPANLYIIGTMNTADKSIAMLDYALRRRFVFYPLYPDERVIEGYYGDAYPRTRAAALELFRAVAGCFTAEGKDLQVGHTYFLVGAPGLEKPGRLYSYGGVDDPGRQLDDDDAYRLLRQKFVFEVAPLVHEYVLAGEDGLDSANVRPIRAAYDEPTKASIALEVLFERLVVPKESAVADDLGPVKDDEAADEQG